MYVSSYTDALESFNRASFDPPTPELHLVPAEGMPPETIVGSPVRLGVPMAFLLSVAITVIGANTL